MRPAIETCPVPVSRRARYAGQQPAASGRHLTSATTAARSGTGHAGCANSPPMLMQYCVYHALGISSDVVYSNPLL